MKLDARHEKLSNFIHTWIDSIYDTDEKRKRFYTYLGLMIQSRLMHDLVNLKDSEYPAYAIVGDTPLIDIINEYNIDDVYNQWLKNNSDC